MPTNTVSPAKLPIMIAAWLLVAVIALIGSGLAGKAHAQAGSDVIPSITLDSNQPGQLVITWATPEQAPTDYRVRWAHTSLGFLSYKDSNEAQRANVYPAAGVNTLTINDLTPGDIYKVHLRARYTSGGKNNGPWSGPWSATATQRVKNHPPATPASLTTSEVAHDSLILSWDNPNDANITGYRIQRGTDANSLHTIEANTGSPSTNYADSTVEPETTYHYAVMALSQDGNGARASTSVTTLAEPESEDPPNEQTVESDPPKGLTESRVKYNSLTLTWDDPNDDKITGYRIRKGTEHDNLLITEQNTRSAKTKYTDPAVNQATTYFYAVTALSTHGESTRSHLEVTTPAQNIQSVPAQTQQAGHQTTVSSTARTSYSMANLVGRDMAQEFQTGANTYKLASVDLYLTGRANDLTVEIRLESASGTLHATLTPSSSASRGHNVYTFTPQQATELNANTHYWVVVKGSNGWFKSKLGGNVTPVPGWTLAENYEFRPKYLYQSDGNREINTGTAFFKVPGHMSMRINRTNNVATAQITISGTPQTQQTLTVDAGIEDQDGLPTTFDYQWMRYSADGTTFEADTGTNSSEYILVPNDEGKKVRVEVESFVDSSNNEEGPFLSDPYPSSNTVTAPSSYTMVSNTGQTVDSNRNVDLSTDAHSQSFNTSNETDGYILTSATVVSADPEGDEFAVQICEVAGNIPTTSCTDLTPPTSFAAGPLSFSSPTDQTITLSKGTTYALVFSVADGTTVTLPVTDSDVEEPTTLPGWYIHNRSQFFQNNQWMNRGYDVCFLIAIQGEASQISQTSGRPAIIGNPSVGQQLTATTVNIDFPDAVAGSLSYQWQRLSTDGPTFEADVGTNSNQYTLTNDDLNKKIRVEVKFIDTADRVVGFPRTSPAYPTGRTISSAPLISNTSQSENSNTPMSTELAQAFTTGPAANGYQLSSITIVYADDDQRHVTLKVCETSSGSPTAECRDLEKPGSFAPGHLRYTVPDTDFHTLDRNTTYAVVLNGTTEPETPPIQVGVTTSNQEDTLSSQGSSVGNAYQQNNDDAWQNVTSGDSIRIAVYADVAPNQPATGAPVITGTARIGQELTATTDNLDDPNGLPTTFDYQWKRYAADGTTFEADIGTNSSQYTITSSELHKKIKLAVSYTDSSNYQEGPLTSSDYPHGTIVITTPDDNLLTSNAGHPTQEITEATTKVAQVFATGKNPNGYELTSVTVSGNNSTVTICSFDSQDASTPGSTCADSPTPASPGHLSPEWFYAVVVDPGTVGITETDAEDQTSLPQWSIKGRYQTRNPQGHWNNAAQDRAIRIQLRGSPNSPFTGLGTPTTGNRQVTLNWQNWVPNNQYTIERIQYRVKQAGAPWNPDWTNVPSSNATTETHTVRNLTNGVEHTIEIRAVFIQDGQTTYSGSESILATPRGSQTAPRNLVASTAGEGGVRISWSDPADSTLTGYQYRQRSTSDDGWNPDWTTIQNSNALTTSYTLTGLTTNLQYTFEVRTVRGADQGPAASSSVTPRGAMPRLQNLTATADDREVSLSWTNPGDHGITGYQHRHQAATESQWNPDWTTMPGSNADTTSHTVRNLTNLTEYTLEVRALRGLEEGPSSTTSANTPDGPATAPDPPSHMSTRAQDQGFTVSWQRPAKEESRAPITLYRVGYREIGTTPWQDTSVSSADCCSATITGLINRHHYEVQVAALNRVGASPSIGPVNVTPQAPATEPPAPTGDADLNLGTIGQGWTATGNNSLIGSCTGTKSFQIIWNGPDEHSRNADEWAAHINTNGGAGVVTHSFTRSPGQQEYYEMNGTVNLQGAGNTTIHVRGRFGPTWGTWTRVTLYCFEQ